MHQQELFLELNRAENIEAATRYLMSCSEIVRLTASNNRARARERLLQKWAAYFREKTENNRRYPEIVQPTDRVFVHYYFDLAPEIRSDILREGIYWKAINERDGLEDPVFYGPAAGPDGSREVRGSVISHEYSVDLYPNEHELKELLSTPGLVGYLNGEEVVGGRA